MTWGHGNIVLDYIIITQSLRVKKFYIIVSLYSSWRWVPCQEKDTRKVNLDKIRIISAKHSSWTYWNVLKTK